mgnify:FL=1
MKVFVLDRFAIIGIILFAAVAAIVFVGASRSAEVYLARGSEVPIYSAERSDNAVCITFDTAWGNEDMDNILAALRDAHCRATFFVTGTWASEHPEDIKKMFNEGHEIANHSENHKHMNTLSETEMLDEIKKCEDTVRNLTGQSEVLFRAPYGEYSKTLVRLCKNTGRYMIQWSLDSLDYKGLSTEEMKKRILPKLKSGDIILFHTGTDNTASALPEILSEIKSRGFVFLTAWDMIYKDNFTVDSTGRQFQSEQKIDGAQQ